MLHFHLAGINNQNFLMLDDETGTWWQQASGKAIHGPLANQSLELVAYDELTFGLWRSENPAGQVLAPDAKYASQYESDWESKVQKLPLVISFPGTPLDSREIIFGIEIGTSSRAFPLTAVLAKSPIEDHLGGTPLLLVAGPDGQSVRAFESRLEGTEIEFFRKTGNPWSLTDTASLSEWNFHGCAITGPASGKCLHQIPLLKDYWFDWRNYHPQTTVYHH